MKKLQSSKLLRNLLLIGVGIVAVLSTRFWQLSDIPAAFVHDEMIYLVQARAVALTGSSLSGNWNPLTITPFNGAFAELPSLLLSLTVPYFSNHFTGGRILHVLMGSAIPIFLGLISESIWKKRKLSLIVVAVAIFNPWLWQFSRMAFDSLFSLFFYLLAFSILLRGKDWWKLMTIPALYMGFYQYQGLKLIFIPLVVMMIAMYFLSESKPIRHWKSFITSKQSVLIAGLILISSLCIFAQYLLYSLPQQQAVGRLSQLRSISSEQVITTVNTQRRLSIDSPFVSLFVNKYSEVTREYAGSFLHLIDPHFLFLSAADLANSFNVIDFGYFYLLDLPLLLVGSVILFIKKESRMMSGAYAALLLVSMMPALFAFGDSSTFRASLFYLLLIPLISLGFYTILELRIRSLNILLYVLYACSIAGFFYNYYFQYPVYAADAQFFSERVLASYVKRIPSDAEIYIRVHDQEFMFNSLLYYNDLYLPSTAAAITTSINNGTFSIGNVHVVTDCSAIPDSPNIVTINSQTVGECSDSKLQKDFSSRTLLIPSLIDGGGLYQINNDPLCGNLILPQYVSPKSLSLFRVESLSVDDFCQNWLVTHGQ